MTEQKKNDKHAVNSEPVAPRKPEDKTGKGMGYIFVGICAIVGSVGMFMFACGDGILDGIMIFLTLFLCVGGALLLWHGVSEFKRSSKFYKFDMDLYNTKLEAYREEKKIWEEKEKEKEEQKSREKAQHAAFLDEVKKGTAEFPSLQFYKECEEQNITTIDDEYSKKKAERILPEIFKGLSPEDYDSYVPKLKEYFNEGKALACEENKKPRTGKIPAKLLESTEFSRKFAKLDCNSKRSAIIISRILELKEEENRQITASKAANQLAGIMGSSYNTKPSNAWAYAGGAASAIAGPAAGIITATSLKEKDDREKTANRAAAQKMYKSLSSTSYGISNNVNGIEKEIEALRILYKSLDSKIILTNQDQDKLCKALNVDVTVTNHDDADAKYTELDVSLKNKFSLYNGQDNELATDGTLQIDIFCDVNTKVDTIYFALPMDGVPFGSRAASVTVATNKYMHGEHTDFRAKVKPYDLWITEI